MTYKLGSLFDGSGGFPLSGVLCGIEPSWAAEVEPYPIAVTRSRFPKMKHLGDISKVNGADIEPVDIITFGSPCQDLSVAGKRAGLKHEANGDEETTRSGLFMEAVRIIKEMRAATNDQYPRFALWENVPGAFSSNKGEDFRIVCEELIKIVEPAAFMPAVPQKGWAYSDSYIGNGWSLAYRVFDAQYWGVPQRRRRIHLVVDFRGECAQEILFEREGLRGYFTQGRTPWQVSASHAQDCAGADDREGEMGERGAGGRQLDAVAYTLKVRSGCDVDSAGKAAGKGALVQTEKAATLACVQDQYLFQPTAILDNIGGQAEYGKVTQVNGTLRSAAQGAVAFAVEPITLEWQTGAGHAMSITEGLSPTLRTATTPAVTYAAEPRVFKADDGSTGDAVPTLVGDHNNRVTDHTALVAEPVFHPQGNDLDRPAVAFGTDVGFFNTQENVSPTLLARQYKDPHLVTYPGREIRYIVRRLTPTECARLQGFADQHGHLEQKADLTDEEYSFWMEVRNTHAAINGKPVKDYTKAQMLTWYNKLWTDSAEYKMWGNGIALPPALYCMQGIMDVLNREEDDAWLL